MKNLFFSIAVLMISLFAFDTKAQVYQKGTKLVDAGVEFTNATGLISVVPVFASFEAGVTDDFGAGARVRYWSKFGLTSVMLQATGNYHFNRLLKLPVQQLDLAAGLGLGGQRVSASGESALGIIITPNVGARYFFTERIGANVRLAYDIYTYDEFTYADANFSFGVSFKF